MESKGPQKILYNSAIWSVFGYILQHPEQGFRGSTLVKALPKTSQAAVYKALRQLVKSQILTEREDSILELNQDLPWVRQMMITDSLMTIQPLVDKLSSLSSKIILFGSRSNGDYTSDSDYDLLVVSTSEEVHRIVMKSAMEEKIQLILKTPEEWIDLYKTSPELYKSIQKGIVLWQRK